MYDNFVVLPKNEKEWKAELTLFLEDWEFPCVGAWDGFHVYINCHLKNFFSFRKRYSVTNMGLIAANKPARSDPCNPRWKLEVNKLKLIRQATKRTKDKRFSHEVRNRIAGWLWSLR